jgi:lipoprotein-anchoring transpeptidase ErfK/SrfK
MARDSMKQVVLPLAVLVALVGVAITGNVSAYADTGCESNASGKVIWISLTAQSVVACDGPAAVYTAEVTSGRPAMGTPTGTFEVISKRANWTMTSGCRPGTACWYPPTHVNYGLLFKSGGYYLHDWPPQEGSEYGPGTERGRFGSHGCVHAPVSVMSQIYNWAAVGTKVVVTG